MLISKEEPGLRSRRRRAVEALSLEDDFVRTTTQYTAGQMCLRIAKMMAVGGSSGMMIYGRFPVSAKRTSLGHSTTGKKHCPKTTHEPRISHHYFVHKAAKDTKCIERRSQITLPCKYIKYRNLTLKQLRTAQYIVASDVQTSTCPSANESPKHH